MGSTIETKQNAQRRALIFGLALIIGITSLPASARAFSLWDTFSDVVQPIAEAASLKSVHQTSETPALRAAVNLDPNPAKGGGDIAVVDDVALMAETGPEGTLADIEESSASDGQISLYVVRKGDTLAAIAKTFGVSVNTIVWANDLGKSAIRPGQTLVILPISGVKHTVVKGETLASIVKKYKGDMEEVLSYNGLEKGSVVAIGDEIIIPYGVEAAPAQSTTRVATSALRGAGGPELSGYFLRPIIGGRKTQALHGYNAVDLGTPVGTQVMAAADGTVTVARASGYNGGYGSYVVISHSNGTQTLYAHLSQVLVGVGTPIQQGQVIGLSGNSGKSTGAHLHFEIRGAKNPF